MSDFRVLPVNAPPLYQYQQLSKAGIIDHYRKGVKNLLFVSPTGGGKTNVFSSLTLDWVISQRRVLIIVHRIELVEQVQQRLLQFGIQSGAIAEGGKPDFSLPVQVAMIQSLSDEITWTPHLVIIDECHHSTANSYLRLWRKYGDALKLGVTATPIRTDGKGFADIYDEMYNPFDISYLIKNGFLVKPKHFICTNLDPDSHFRVANGEYDMAAQSKIMRQKKQIADVITSYQTYIPNKKAVVFAVDVLHSLDIVRRFNEVGIPAAHLDGEIPTLERKRIVQEYRDNKIKVLSNYNIIAEGFDVPDIEATILAKKSKSLSWYCQANGRCLRSDKKNPNKKYGYILDCAGAWLDHGCAGINYEWSLEGNEDKITESIQKSTRLMNRRRNGDIKPILPPEEMKGVDLIALDEQMSRLVEFDRMYHDFKHHKLHVEYDFEIVEKYNSWLNIQGLDFTEIEMKYCMAKMGNDNHTFSKKQWQNLLNQNFI